MKHVSKILLVLSLALLSATTASAQGPVTTTTSNPSGTVTTTTVNGGSSSTVTMPANMNAMYEGYATKLNQALGDCQPYQALVPHPLNPNLKIQQQVYGMENGKCKYVQVMGAMTQSCLLSDQQRSDIKAKGTSALNGDYADKSTCTTTINHP